DAYPPGGLAGRLLAHGLTSIAGSFGAWLTLFGCTAIGTTVLFRIRWGRMAEGAVGAGEKALPWVGHQVGGAAGTVKGAAGAMLGGLSAGIWGAVSELAGQVGFTLRRMIRSLVRREDDDDWYGTSTSRIEDLDADTDARVPTSLIEVTLSASPALAEV